MAAPLTFGDPPPEAFLVIGTARREGEADNEQPQLDLPDSEPADAAESEHAAHLRHAYTRFHANPCVRALGLGPAGAKCKTCVRLYTRRFGRRTYYKCALRPETSGPASDHRAGWDACAKYAFLSRSPQETSQ